MRGLLLWALLILLCDTAIRVLSWSLLVLIPLLAADLWLLSGAMRWPATILLLAVGFCIFLFKERLSPGDRARIGWLLLAVLIWLSATAFDGSVVAKWPWSRIAGGLAAASVFFACSTFLPLIDPRKRWQRNALLGTAALGCVPFLPVLFGTSSFRDAFQPGGTLAGLPAYTQPAAVCVGVLLPLALATAIVLSYRSFRWRETTLVRERWFELSMVFVSILTGVITMTRA